MNRLKIGLFWILVLFVFTFCSCSKDRNSIDKNTGDTDSIKITTQIDTEYKGKISIISIKNLRPGKNNALDVFIDVKNLSEKDLIFWFGGEWSNASDQFRGRQIFQVTADAGQIATIQLGTNSKDVVKLATQFSVKKPGEKTHSGTFAFTRDIELSSIPSGTLKGTAGGKQFQAKEVLFIYNANSDEWILEIWDQEINKARDISLWDDNRQSIKIVLPGEPYFGSIFKKPFGQGGGHFQISSKSSNVGTTTWKASNTWILSADSWDRSEWDESGDDSMQFGGSASGRLAVCYESSEADFPNAFIAGKFSNAKIIYNGKPN